MGHLSISLLGGFQVALDGQPVRGFSSARVRALLAYLAVEHARPHSRARLAGLLWPEHPERVAHNNLRQVLANLRDVIADHDSDPPFLHVSYDNLQFNASSDHELDVATFTGLLHQCEVHAHRRLAGCSSCAARMEQAIGLYQADFLADFFLKDSEPFEEWALAWRERLRDGALEALHTLADYHELHENYERAARYAARQLQFDAWREEAHRQAMRALALAGRRSEALAQYRSCSWLLAADLDARPAAETTALYEQIRSGRALRPAGAAEHDGLPAEPCSFVGRERELTELCDLLENPRCRLLTLTGPGGIGKTCLAQKVAFQSRFGFRDGACFVPLASISSPQFLVLALARATRLVFAGSADPTQQLLRHLRGMEILLVLDGFDQLTGAARLLSEILASAPRLAFLITARTRLRLPEEWVYQVRGLSVPAASEEDGDSAAATPDELERYESVQLFLASARRADHDWQPSGEDKAHIAAICRAVEGMPLALELAAGWLRLYSPAEVASEIAKGLDVLAVPGSHGGEMADSRSLRLVFDRSWRLLSAEEQKVLARLSVFQGSFGRQAATEVAGASPALLLGLADKSLLTVSTSDRHALHPLLRQYAAEHLGAMDCAEEARDRHAAYYVDLLHGCLLDSACQEGSAAAMSLTEDVENVAVALRHVIGQGGVGNLEPVLSRLWIAFDHRGRYRTAEAFFAWAVRQLEEGSTLAVEDAEPKGRALGQLLLQWAWFCLCLGRMDQAMALLDRALPLVDESEDRSLLAGALYRAAILAAGPPIRGPAAGSDPA